MIFRAEIAGRDWIAIEINTAAKNNQYLITASGCLSFLRKVEAVRAQVKTETDLTTFPLPKNALDHGSLLIREVILKARGEWKLPYQEAELCHCRAIPTAVVDQAIVCGALTPEMVSRFTSAGSACGTCKGETESLIRYRHNIQASEHKV